MMGAMTAHSHEPNPIAGAEVKFDARGVAPLESMHATLWPQQAGVRRLYFKFWRRQHHQCRVAEEYQLAARFEEPCCLWNPFVRITPDRGPVLADGEVETGASEVQRELEPESLVEVPCSLV